MPVSETGGDPDGVMAEQQPGLDSLLGLQPGALQGLKMEGLWYPEAMTEPGGCALTFWSGVREGCSPF